MTLFSHTIGQGPDIVLLHGWGLYSGVWANLAEALKAEYRITLVDLPGHGQSSASPGLSNLEELCRALRDEVSEHAIWVGWSMGGLVAIQLALLYPAAVERLIVVSGSPCFCQRDDWQSGVSLEIFNRFANGIDENAQATLRQFLALQVTPNANGRVILKQLRAVAAGHAPDLPVLKQGLGLLEQTDLRHELERLGMPVRFILGAEDRLVNAGTGQKISNGMINYRYDVMKGSGHAPFLDNQQKFIEILKVCLND